MQKAGATNSGNIMLILSFEGTIGSLRAAWALVRTRWMEWRIAVGGA